MSTRTFSLARLPLLLALLTSSACSSSGIECDDAAIRQIVAEFSTGLEKLSYTSPQKVTGNDVTAAFEGSVTPELLAALVSDPGQAPGMQDTTRWPAKLEVTSIRGMKDACRVDVDASYVRHARGENGPRVEHEPTILRVVSTADGAWRVADYRPDTGSGE
jgi:hypothetical protein